MAYVALFSAAHDVPLEIAIGLFVVPLAGTLGVVLANIVTLRPRAVWILKSLLTGVFSVAWSCCAFYVLKFGLAAMLVGWIGSVGIACLVWHATDR